jgi:hypothetical protein
MYLFISALSRIPYGQAALRTGQARRRFRPDDARTVTVPSPQGAGQLFIASRLERISADVFINRPMEPERALSRLSRLSGLSGCFTFKLSEQ